MRWNRSHAISISFQALWATMNRVLWRWGSTRNRRINRFPATVLALLLYYICLWRWELKKTAPEVPKQLSAWTIGTKHVIIAERIFSPWASPLGSQVDFPHYVSERVPRACPVLYEQNWILSHSPFSLRYYSARYTVWQWAPTGRNINLHLWHGTAKQNLVRVVMQHRSVSVCSCRASMFEIMNLSVQKTQCEWLFCHVRGSVFMMRGEERLRKHSR